MSRPFYCNCSENSRSVLSECIGRKCKSKGKIVRCCSNCATCFKCGEMERIKKREEEIFWKVVRKYMLKYFCSETELKYFFSLLCGLSKGKTNMVVLESNSAMNQECVQKCLIRLFPKVFSLIDENDIDNSKIYMNDVCHHPDSKKMEHVRKYGLKVLFFSGLNSLHPYLPKNHERIESEVYSFGEDNGPNPDEIRIIHAHFSRMGV